MASHQHLLVWQKAFNLCLKVYALTNHYPKQELFTLTSQSRSSALSIPSNIAEGRARFSRQEYLRFLRIARRFIGGT